MARVPHPRGPEYGYMYTTPEEALAGNDLPVVIPREDYEARLKDPEIQETSARARRMLESNVEFMVEVAPNVLAIDHNLARRAQMHVIEGGKSSEAA